VQLVLTLFAQCMGIYISITQCHLFIQSKVLHWGKIHPHLARLFIFYV